jgi:hypothetical protein
MPYKMKSAGDARRLMAGRRDGDLQSFDAHYPVVEGGRCELIDAGVVGPCK